MSLLKEDKFEKDGYILYMHVYKVKLLLGTPKVNTPSYEEIKWEKASLQFSNMNVFGACTTLYKRHLKNK